MYRATRYHADAVRRNDRLASPQIAIAAGSLAHCERAATRIGAGAMITEIETGWQRFYFGDRGTIRISGAF